MSALNAVEKAFPGGARVVWVIDGQEESSSLRVCTPGGSSNSRAAPAVSDRSITLEGRSTSTVPGTSGGLQVDARKTKRVVQVPRENHQWRPIF
jgi:hypothetical protein